MLKLANEDEALGFLAGGQVKQKGALNAGIREWFQIHAKQAFMSARGTSRPTICFPVDTEIRAYFCATIIYSLNLRSSHRFISSEAILRELQSGANPQVND